MGREDTEIKAQPATLGHQVCPPQSEASVELWSIDVAPVRPMCPLDLSLGKQPTKEEPSEGTDKRHVSSPGVPENGALGKEVFQCGWKSRVYGGPGEEGQGWVWEQLQHVLLCDWRSGCPRSLP